MKKISPYNFYFTICIYRLIQLIVLQFLPFYFANRAGTEVASIKINFITCLELLIWIVSVLIVKFNSSEQIKLNTLKVSLIFFLLLYSFYLIYDLFFGVLKLSFVAILWLSVILINLYLVDQEEHRERRERAENVPN